MLMPNLIVLRGPVGAGKTSIMRALTEKIPDCSAVEIDALKRMIDPTGSSVWRREAALTAALSLTKALLERGRAVVTETHARWPEQTSQFYDLAHEVADVALTGVLVKAPYEVCLDRAKQRSVPGISYPINEAMVASYYVNLEPLANELSVDTTQYSPAETARDIVFAMQERNRVETG